MKSCAFRLGVLPVPGEIACASEVGLEQLGMPDATGGLTVLPRQIVNG